MDKAITIADVLTFVGVGVVAVVVAGGLLAVLAAYAKGFTR